MSVLGSVGATLPVCLCSFFLMLLSLWSVCVSQLVRMYLEVPEGLGPAVKHLSGCFPSWPWYFQFLLSTDDSVYFVSHLVVLFLEHTDYQNLAPCYAVVCWIVSRHPGSCLVQQTSASIDLVLNSCSCAAMMIASVLSFNPVLSSHCSVVLMSTTSSACGTSHAGAYPSRMIPAPVASSGLSPA